jgi:Fe-Mn family superoxide dismutase
MQNEFRKYVMIVEGTKETLSLNRLPYKRTELEPVMSEATLDYHYGKLAKAYVDRFNAGEGDPKFNKNGADLHNIFFPQLRPPKAGNKPAGNISDLINRNFKSFDAFKEEVVKEAMGIQGSGWIFLDRNGKLQTIPNHSITGNTDRIVLLIDWWEHAWALDYQSDKKKYLENFWRIINWEFVNQRLV